MITNVDLYVSNDGISKFSYWWKKENKDIKKEWAYLPKRKWCKLIVIQTGINKTLLYQ